MARRNLEVGAIKDVSGEVNIAAGDIIKNIKTIHQRALTAAEAAAHARKLESKLLAQGIAALVQNLSTQASEGIASDSPYKGLLPYSLNEAEIFYGRNKAKKDLLLHIKQSPLTVLHAESGAGKSSLLQAGIAAQFIANGHLAVYLRPYHADPVEFIKRMFLPELTQAPALAGGSLRDFLRQVCSVLGAKSSLYLLLDQFEEFFQLKKDERQPFLESLADCLNDPSLKVRWVLALRKEALSDLAELESFGITQFKNTYRLNRLSRGEAQEAMIEPARRYDIAFEPALIEHILDTLTTNDEVRPTHLQLICFALTDDLPEEKTLTLAYYTEHEGGTEGILRDYLKRQLEDLPASEQTLAWKVLRALISADRQRALKTYAQLIQELKTSGVSKKQIETILSRLVERRLLFTQTQPASAEVFELAHDYLIKEIELDPQEQALKAAQELLEQETRTYQRHKTLLSPERLAVIEPYQNELNISADAEALLHESRKAVQAEQRVRERRRNITLGISSAVAIAMSLLSIWGFRSSQEAFKQAEEAQKQANIALARQLAAQAQSINGAGDSKQSTSILLAIQSMKTFPNSLASEVLLGNTSVQPTFLTGYKGWVESVSFSSNGKYILASGCDQYDEADFTCTQRLANILDASTGKEVARMPLDQTVELVVFSQDGQFLATNTENKLQVWDVFAKNEVAHMFAADTVYKIIFSLNGNYLASGACSQKDDYGSCIDGDSTLEVWETSTGNRIDQTKFESHVNALAFSLESRFLAAGIDDGTAHIWDSTTGAKFAHPVHEGSVLAIAFSPDSKYVVSGGFDIAARVWETSTGQEIAKFEHSGEEIASVAFSPSGDYVISGTHYYSVIAGGSHDAIVWEAFTGIEVARRTHEGSITSVAFSTNGKHVLSVSADGMIHVWEAATGNELTSRWEQSFNSSASFSPDGNYIVSGDETGHIVIWNVQGGHPIDLITQKSGVIKAAFSLDGKYAIAAGVDGMIHVWETATGSEISTITYGLSPLPWISFLAISPDNRYIIASVDDEQTSRIWELATGTEINRGTYDNDLHFIALSPNGKYVVAVEGEKDALVWEVATGREIARITHDEAVTSAAFSPDSQYVVSGSNDKTARVWEVATENEVGRMTHEGPVFRVAFSPDGQHLVSAGCNKSDESSFECLQSTAIVWKVTTGQEANRFIHAGWISPVAFSQDGKYLITGSSDHTARVWEFLTGREIARMTHDGEVSAVAFSPDGKYAMSGGCDTRDAFYVCTRGTARIWETSTGNEISRMLFDEGVNSVAFSPNGKYVMAGAGQSYFEFQGNALRVWMYLPDDLIADACERTGRNLTRIEYATYVNSNPGAYDRNYANDPTCKDLPVELTATPTIQP